MQYKIVKTGPEEKPPFVIVERSDKVQYKWCFREDDPELPNYKPGMILEKAPENVYRTVPVFIPKGAKAKKIGNVNLTKRVYW